MAAPDSTLQPQFPELAGYVKEHAIRRGDFTLASGQKSSIYCDLRLVTMQGRGLSLVSEAMIKILADYEFDAVGGMAMGAVPIAAGVAQRLHQGHQRDLPAFFIRKESKHHGTQKRIEGPIPPAPAKVAIVEDVITTAGSTLAAIEVVQEAGYEVMLALSILDREAGGTAAIESRGIESRSLLRLSELELQD